MTFTCVYCDDDDDIVRKIFILPPHRNIFRYLFIKFDYNFNENESTYLRVVLIHLLMYIILIKCEYKLFGMCLVQF